MRRRTAVGGAIVVVVLLAAFVAGRGQVPHTVALSGGGDTGALPAVCLGAGLTLALGYGSYATPVSGGRADVSASPSWQNAALQLAPASTITSGDGPYTLCSYVADHPSPFSTRGGDDTVVCVLVDPAGAASVVSARTAGDTDCATAEATD